MSKRTKSKLRNFKIFLSKEVFNGRYIVRNILITTIIASLIVTTVGMTVLASQSKGTEVEAEESVRQSYTIGSLDTSVINVDSINYLLAEMDANSETGVEANEVIVVSDALVVKGKVIDDDVFVRATASYMGEIVATAYQDEEYAVDESKSDEDWVCVVLEDGNLGYINSMFISMEEPEKAVEEEQVEESDKVVETETETSQAEKPVSATGTAEKVDDTSDDNKQTTGGIVETPNQNTTEATKESTETTTESTTEETTEAPVTTEQESTDKPYREDAVVDAGVPVPTTYRSPMTLSEEDIHLMAVIVTLESGGESYDGQLAVANVIINRMLAGHWGTTVSEVVYAPYQFSCISSPKMSYYMANGAQESCIQAVKEALSGVNNIGNYLYFRALYVTNLDDYSVYSVIGNHMFH